MNHDPSLSETVRKKAERLERAKRRDAGRGFRELFRTGALGWMLILPAVLFAFLARWAFHETHQRWLSVLLLGVGLAIGIAGVVRQVRRSLEEREEEHDDD